MICYTPQCYAKLWHYWSDFPMPWSAEPSATRCDQTVMLHVIASPMARLCLLSSHPRHNIPSAYMLKLNFHKKTLLMVVTSYHLRLHSVEQCKSPLLAAVTRYATRHRVTNKSDIVLPMARFHGVLTDMMNSLFVCYVQLSNTVYYHWLKWQCVTDARCRWVPSHRRHNELSPTYITLLGYLYITWHCVADDPPPHGVEPSATHTQNCLSFVIQCLLIFYALRIVSWNIINIASLMWPHYQWRYPWQKPVSRPQTNLNPWCHVICP